VLHYVARPPAPPLAEFVDYVWASQGAPEHAKERVVPTGTLELCVSLVEGEGRIYDAAGRSRPLSRAIVSGAYRRWTPICREGHAPRGKNKTKVIRFESFAACRDELATLLWVRVNGYQRRATDG
jgi:hypothetical protein